uniref:Facilitated trehalose transporter Tret1-like n=1 Tax=Diabrotica virgifera virgifera TaxID=50390 RepID=A0A6P7FMJ8_DIAVI
MNTRTSEEIKYAPVSRNGFQEINYIHERKSDTLYVYFTIITIVLTWIGGVATSVWSSPAIMKMKSNDTNINPLGRPITTEEISMLLGIPGIIALTGFILFPKLADCIGRKKSLLVAALLMFLSIVATSFTKDITSLIVFITFINIFFFGILAIVPVYITEICESHNRAKFSCIMTLCIPLGQLYVYIIGPIFSFRTFTLLTAAPLIPFMVLYSFATESPVFLLSKGRREECLNALTKLRGNKSEKELELDLIQMRESLSSSKQCKSVRTLSLLRTKRTRVGIMLGFLPITVQYFCGAAVFMPLMAPILDESGSNLSGNTLAMIVGAVKVTSFGFTSIIVERVGKKKLLVISSAATAIPITLLGVFFYLKSIGSPLVLQNRWVPLVSVVAFFIFYSIGLGSIPLGLIGELFTLDCRATATGLIMTIVNLLCIIYTASYPLLAEAIGSHSCMWIFGFTCCLGAILIKFVYPETTGKSITEIQQILIRY